MSGPQASGLQRLHQWASSLSIHSTALAVSPVGDSFVTPMFKDLTLQLPALHQVEHHTTWDSHAEKSHLLINMAEELTFDPQWAATLEPRLPPQPGSSPRHASIFRPFVTLTFATSLDSGLSLAPGVRTRLSGPDSKAMTHYLRSRHDAILVGIGTLLADDPALNCRLAGSPSPPRPILIDPGLRWQPKHDDKVLQIQRSGRGLAPYVLCACPVKDVPGDQKALLEAHGGQYISCTASNSGSGDSKRFSWGDILQILHENKLASVMVEGGGHIINSLLEPSNHQLIDSVIVTIAPVWLGRGSVTVSPDRIRDKSGTALPVARLSNVSWHPFGEDVVLCGDLRG
ncbi:GRF zinc finger domain containing protein [Sarocladium implicatum]|nr:GRF zinc finger domain containing protein [Sarocladium implicatum]